MEHQVLLCGCGEELKLATETDGLLLRAAHRKREGCVVVCELATEWAALLSSWAADKEFKLATEKAALTASGELLVNNRERCSGVIQLVNGVGGRRIRNGHLEG